MNPFKFNEHGVCMNPEVAVRVMAQGCSCTITVAMLDDGTWCFGNKLQVKTSSWSHGAGFGSDKSAKWRADYIADTKEGVLRLAMRQIKAQCPSPSFKRLIVEAINSVIEREHPSLFIGLGESA